MVSPRTDTRVALGWSALGGGCWPSAIRRTPSLPLGASMVPTLTHRLTVSRWTPQALAASEIVGPIVAAPGACTRVALGRDHRGGGSHSRGAPGARPQGGPGVSP